MKSAYCTFALLMIACVIAGCAPTVYDDPLAVMMDRQQSIGDRIDAARQAERQLPDDAHRIADLRTLTWERGHPTALRLLAVDALVRHDESAAKAYLASAIALMNDWAVIEHVLDIAVEKHWTDFTPAIVRSYARDAWVYPDDAARPEAKALRALHPDQTVEQTVFDVFAHDPSADVRQRAAAWVLMNRLVADREKLLAMLRHVQATDPLVLDLQAAANDLHITADSLETIAWLQSLRAAEHRPFWAAAKQAVASLTAEQRRGLELRHIPLLVHLHARGDSALSMTRDQLLAEATRFIATQQHFNKSAGYDGGNPDRDQTLDHWQPQLSWGDLLVMHTVIGMMHNPDACVAIFRQADADVQDTTTEFGGLLTWNNADTLIVRPYPPMIHKHNLVYYPPPQLTLDAYFALAHYHLHAQQYDNADWAGPGRGDLDRIADTQRYNGVLFTCIDRKRINVDFYRQGGVVVDLGTIHR